MDFHMSGFHMLAWFGWNPQSIRTSLLSFSLNANLTQMITIQSFHFEIITWPNHTMIGVSLWVAQYKVTHTIEYITIYMYMISLYECVNLICVC